MKGRLLKAMARLASEQYQDAYIVNGTSEEYVLPEDLIEDLASLCQLAEKTHYTKLFALNEHEVLAAMLLKLKALGPGFWTEAQRNGADHLVHENAIWSDLRSSAARSLREFGINSSEIAPEQIDDQLSSK
jgi:hypothetical protein